jgi:trimeric autotransporter adhesin
VFSHVPTALERAGDFSKTTVNGSSVQLFDPAHPGTPLGSGTSVPTDLISPQAAALLNYIPLPNVTNGSRQNFHFSSAAAADSDTLAVRLTHNFGAVTGQRGTPGTPGAGGGGRSGRSRNNLSFGLNYQRNESDNLEPFPLLFGNTHTNGFNANVGWAVSKGKLSNQLRFTWNRSRVHAGSHFAGVTPVQQNADIAYGTSPDPLSDPANFGLPNIAFADYSSLSDTTPSQRDSQTFSLSESLGWVRGKHHLHFGGDYRWIDNKAFASANPRSTFTFTGSTTANYATDPKTGLPAPVSGTGYDFADFLLGYAQQTTLAYSQVHDQYLGNSYDLFVQNDWRVKGNLTVNLGLRYELISPFHEAHGQLENLITTFDAEGNFVSAAAVSPGGVYGRTLVHPDRNNFAPRVGIAWKPFGAKTVVRAGYGINYNLGQYASVAQSLASHPPCATTPSPCAVTQTNGTSTPTGPSTLTLANGFSSAPVATSNNYAINPNYRTAYVQLWNLNVQHELTPTLLLNVGYTGSKGTALDMLRAPNRGPGGVINPSVAPFNWETSQGSSILHAASVRLRKRMTKGVAVGGTYTYSKSIDNASSIGGGTQVVAQDDRNLRAERGLSSFDQRHKLTGDWTVELPWGEGRKWLTRSRITQKVLGDWLLQSSFTVASGTPLTARVLGSFSNVAGGTNGTLRANYNGEPIQVGDRSIKQWFNTAAFSLPAAGSYGNSGRNTIIGPGSWLMSLVLSKNIPLKDSMGLEIRAEADNVLNHPNYSGLDTVVNSPTFGQVTSVASMRKMILSLHYRF